MKDRGPRACHDELGMGGGGSQTPGHPGTAGLRRAGNRVGGRQAEDDDEFRAKGIGTPA